MATITGSSDAHPRNAGIAYVIVAMTALSLQDMLIKLLSTDYPLHQIIFSRSMIAIVISFAMIGFEGGYHQLKSTRPMLHLLRASLLVIGNMCYFLAVAAMPLAEALALFFIAPLLITALSVPLLGERVGALRWSAIGVAMIGVVVMLQPGAEIFNPVALLPLFGAFTYAFMAVLTRRLGATDKASVMAFYGQLGFLSFSGALGLLIGDGRFAGGSNPSLEFLLRAWIWPSQHDALLIASCGVLIAIVGYCLSHAYRVSPAAVVAPFEYVELPLAVIWGYLVWQHLPGPTTWFGILLIAMAGLYVLLRERQLAARTLRTTAVAIACLAAALALLPKSARAGEENWRRGINMGDYLAYPKGSTWPLFIGPRARISNDELQRLRTAGFDFIRLAVEPGPFLDSTPQQVAELEARLLTFVEQAKRAGLKVMVTGWARHEAPHWSPARILANPDGASFAAYAAFLTRLAGLLSRFPPQHWSLQLMNEPQPACRRTVGADWTSLQLRLFKQIRALAPDATIVITGNCWSKLEGLDMLDLTAFDARVLVDVHYYDPWIFTHQSATWSQAWVRHVAGLSYPAERTDPAAANAASTRLFELRQTGGPAALAEAKRNIHRYIEAAHGPRQIRADIARIAAWADRQGLPRARVIVGEFGVYRVPGEAAIVEDGSRERWISTVREAAEGNGLGFAFYAYHSGFGLVIDDERATFHHPTLKALGLNIPR